MVTSTTGHIHQRRDYRAPVHEAPGRCLRLSSDDVWSDQQAALPPFEVLRVVWIGVGKQAGSELSLDPLELATELA